MPRKFLRELRRRHVYRVAAAYAVVGWLLVQIATQVFPFFHIPDWSVRLLVLLVLAGFPVALVLAWAFDATPHGIVRTDAGGQPVSHRARRGTIAVGALGVLIAVIAGGGYWWWHRALPIAQSTIAVSATRPVAGSTVAKPVVGAAASMAQAMAIPAKSVAVLPFVNESGEKDRQYFSDGLSEDLITALSQFGGLKVISRNSSFQFRDSKDDSKTIGERLGVAHLLEGSVQRTGDMVRISAELVNVADGSTLWSQRYDRPYKDLFALQDDITRAVTGELKAKLLEGNEAVAQSDRPPSGNLTAYSAYLQGKFYLARGTEADIRKAIGSYNEAIHLDPRYAQAYAGLSNAEANPSAIFALGRHAPQAFARARAAAKTALALDPELAAAHRAHARVLFWVDLDWIGAEAENRRALQLAPNDDLAKIMLGTTLATLGHPNQSIELTRQALATGPLNDDGYYWLATYLMSLGRLDEAGQAIRKAIELQSSVAFYSSQLASIEVLRGNAATALSTALRTPVGVWHDSALALAQQISGDRAAADAALKTLVDKDADNAAYQIAEVYALRKDADNTFAWLDHAWANRDPGISLLLYDPLILRYRDDPRFAAFCKKVGLPTTDAVAMK